MVSHSPLRLVVFPDGHQVDGLTLAQFRSAVGPSHMPGGSTSSARGVSLPNGRALNDGSIVPYLAKDVGFALDRLPALNQTDPNRILTGKLDMQRVGAVGVSLGGIEVGEACRVDARLRACLMMDAPMPTDVVDAGLRQPSMWLARDAASRGDLAHRAGEPLLTQRAIAGPCRRSGLSSAHRAFHPAPA